MMERQNKVDFESPCQYFYPFSYRTSIRCLDVRDLVQDMEKLPFTPCEDPALTSLEAVSLRSESGSSSLIRVLERPERPENFRFTEISESFPRLRGFLESIELAQCRVRIFKQKPGELVPAHLDGCNRYRDGRMVPPDLQVIRLMIPLNESPGFLYRWGTSRHQLEAVPLRAGQVLAWDPHLAWHETENTDPVRSRYSICMIARPGPWLRSILAI